MSNVVAVKQNPKKPENAFITLDDGTDAWCPDYEKAKALVIGQPLPDGWRQDQGEYGPRIFPPSDRKGGGQAAWRNTKEGAEFEAENWRRKQAIEQERTDRRTALMQAVAADGEWLDNATEMYAWLRKSAGSAPSMLAADTGSDRSPFRPEPGPSAVEPGKAAAEMGGAAGTGTGEGLKPAASHVCPACGSPNISRKGHTWTCAACKQEWEI